MRDDILFEQRVSIQAAAYTIYLELTPNNKKPLTPREFQDKFIDNWEIFGITLTALQPGKCFCGIIPTQVSGFDLGL